MNKMGSNRTFMELKFKRIGVEASPHQCSNRTFMELKYRLRVEIRPHISF